MGFNLFVADPDVWRNPELKPEVTEYYDYVITYVDDIIVVSMYSVGILEDIARFSRFNNDNIGMISIYLGSVIVKKTVDGVDFWSISCQNYAKAMIDNVVE